MTKTQPAAPVRARRIPNAKPGEVVNIDEKRAATSADADKARSKAVAATVKTAEEKAKLKKAQLEQKQAQREADKKAKEAAVAKMEKTLAPLAKEINVRLEKVAMIEGKADDHRLAAAIHLEECRKKCEEAGVSFKKWAEANIVNQSYENVRKLVYIGAFPEDQGGPAKALEDMRSKNKAANKALREKKAKADKPKLSKPENNISAPPADSGKGARKETAFQRAEAAFSEMPPETAKEVVASQAAQLGGQFLTDKEVKSLKSGGGATGVDGITAAFDALKAQDRLAVIDHIEQKTGMFLIGPEDKKLLDAAKKAAKKAA